jgi:hypothetical protein
MMLYYYVYQSFAGLSVLKLDLKLAAFLVLTVVGGILHCGSV